MSESRKKIHAPRQMQNVFVFLLLAIFAISAIFLTALSAQVYRDTVQVSSENNSARILDAILRGAAQGEDAGIASIQEEGRVVSEEDGVITEEAGIPVLTFTNDYDGEVYLRRLYCAEGWLRESFMSAEYDFVPSAGEELMEMISFEPEIRDHLLTARAEMPDGHWEEIQVYLWAGGAKE